MNRTALSVLLLVLAFLGIADAWYLAASALSHTALSCDLGAVLDGCNIVAKSEYSHFLGLPLALYGVFFFASIFVLAALSLVLEHRFIYKAIYALSVIGSIASVVFLAIQFIFIKALCIYCIASAVVAFMLWFAAHDLYRKRPKTVTTVIT